MSVGGYPLRYFPGDTRGRQDIGIGSSGELALIQTVTVGIPNGGGPAVVAVPLTPSSALASLSIEAWISNFGGSNVHLLRDRVSLVAAQGLLQLPGILSQFLMTLTYAGPTTVTDNAPPNAVTVFFEAANNSGQAQLVTMKMVGYE